MWIRVPKSALNSYSRVVKEYCEAVDELRADLLGSRYSPTRMETEKNLPSSVPKTHTIDDGRAPFPSGITSIKTVSILSHIRDYIKTRNYLVIAHVA